MKIRLTHIVSLLAALPVLMTASCSTTRTLSEGEYRLAKNNIEVTNSKKFNTNSLHQYIKQSSNSYLLEPIPLHIQLGRSGRQRHLGEILQKNRGRTGDL